MLFISPKPYFIRTAENVSMYTESPTETTQGHSQRSTKSQPSQPHAADRSQWQRSCWLAAEAIENSQTETAKEKREQALAKTRPPNMCTHLRIPYWFRFTQDNTLK